jgi:hypothetical protein
MLSVNRGLRQLFSESPTKRDCQRGPLPKLLSHHPGKDPTNYEADQGSSVPGQLPGRWNDVLIFVWRAEIYAELREVNDDLQEFDQKLEPCWEVGKSILRLPPLRRSHMPRSCRACT